MPDTNYKPCSITASLDQNTLIVSLSGDWLLAADLPATDAVMRQIGAGLGIRRIQFITAGLERWDSLLLTELIKILDCAKRGGIVTELATLPAAVQRLLTLVYATPVSDETAPPPAAGAWRESLAAAWRQAVAEAQQMLIFLGELFISSRSSLRGRSCFRRQDVLLYIQECGPAALPIVSLISLLVGLILAFVGALELSLFGAQIYIANLVSLGMTREMGGLMTAIIMAGRTGAAYAAQLGTMHVNNEIDALKTMDLEPLAFLVLPRLLALICIMPLLCLYADLMGIIGGGLVTVNLFDVSLTEYLDRTVKAVQFKDFAVGFVKSSVFGVLIAFSGCLRGMQCGRSASAVGDAATSAVVTSIVLIVVADSIMTIICNRLGI
ncbi:MAG: ABC transporter permease [Methylomonas sp.]|jgi:phospholipid/cholesterol/gamma-HCH transport system permease protein